MVIPQPEQASSSKDATGDLPPGEIPEASMEPQVVEPTEDLPAGDISAKEAPVEDVEIEEVEEEVDVPQDEQMQRQENEEECDYDKDELTEEQFQRAHEIVNSDMIERISREEPSDSDLEEEVPPLETRPRIANEVQARFINAMCNEELARIDAVLAAEKPAREAIRRATREADQRQDAPMATGDIPTGEISEVPTGQAVTHGDTILDSVCVKQEPISSKFLCRAQLSLWTEDVLARKDFSYGVSLTQCEHNI